jgi:predicted GNAT family N-acyltransferase
MTLIFLLFAEKLQQYFNQHTFKKEEEVYNREGIKYVPMFLSAPIEIALLVFG